MAGHILLHERRRHSSLRSLWRCLRARRGSETAKPVLFGHHKPPHNTKRILKQKDGRGREVRREGLGQRFASEIRATCYRPSGEAERDVGCGF